jgi:DNA-binding MarR family transcriptional regulator
MYGSAHLKSVAVQRLERTLAEMQHDPAHCFHRHISRTARVVGAQFDKALASAGFTAGQFTILMTVARTGPLPVGRLAGELGMDATTLSRVMRPLLRRGWLALEPGIDRRVRIVIATEEGIERLIGALPAWERTQTETLAAFDAVCWAELRHGIAALRHGLLQQRVGKRAPVARRA